MQVQIKQIDTTLPLPNYATPGSVGFDLICRQDTEVPRTTIARIPGNVTIKTPEGYMLLITLRSGTPSRKSLLIPHGVGVIDQDYCGEGDEVLIQVYNFSHTTVWVRRGEKIAQAFLCFVLNGKR